MTETDTLPARFAMPIAKNIFEFDYDTEWTQRINAVHNDGMCFHWIDAAWALMLVKQGILPKRHHTDVLESIESFLGEMNRANERFGGLEAYVMKRNGPEAGGSLTLTRTVPPARQPMAVRREALLTLCVLLDVHDAILHVAEQHLDTVMPGYTHIRHAQPTTFGHYMLSVFDPLDRVLRQIEDGYKAVNMNELGCAALSGTSFDIDRNLVGDYLGFDGLLENANDAVSFTDGYVTLMAAVANYTTVFSRLCLDLNYWSSLEYDFMEVPWLTVPYTPHKEGGKGSGHSHLMPNKTANQPYLERARVAPAELLGVLTESLTMGVRAPHGDGHEMLHMAEAPVRGLRRTASYLNVFIYTLPRMTIKKERMLAVARQGYSGAVELASELVRRFELDYRTAHAVLHDFVKESEKRGIPACEADIGIFDSCCEEVLERKLELTAEELRELLDPIISVQRCVSQGGVAPSESARMLESRKARLRQARKRHEERIKKLEDSKAKMMADLQALRA